MTDQYLLELALLLIVAIMAARGARLLHVPDVVLLLLAGIALGPSWLGWLQLTPNLGGVQLVVIVGAAYILFRGGMRLELAVLRTVWLTLGLLVTVGVLITAGITALPVAALFGLPLAPALLVAVIIAPTDPATLIPVLDQARVARTLKQTIVAESALNDPIGTVLTFTLLAMVQGHAALSWSVLSALLWKAGVGLSVGAVAGMAAALVVFEARWFAGLAEIVLVALVILAYSVATRLDASGYMAAFVAGVVVGNMHLRHHRLGRVTVVRHGQFSHFLDTLAILFRLLLFMLLGSEIDLHTLTGALLPALGVALVFMLVARPVAVLASVLPDRRARWRAKEILFLAWTRETGVIPAALVATLAALGAPYLRPITAVTTAAILLTVLVQGSTAGPLARALGLTHPEQPIIPPAPPVAGPVVPPPPHGSEPASG